MLDGVSSITGQKSVLQRRRSISNAFQASLDGLSVIGISWALVTYHFGVITPEYVILILILMGAMAVVYDGYAIYRTNNAFTGKALALLKAWTLTFAILLVIGFLTRQSESFSRLLIAQIYCFGYVAQALLHLAVRLLRKSLHSSQPQNAVIVGHGRLANYLAQKISSNPWLGQQLVGCVSLKDTSGKPGASPEGLKILGLASDMPDIVEQHDVRAVYIVTPLEASNSLEDIYFSLLDKHVAVHWIPDIFSLRLVNHSVKEIAGIPVLTISETPLTGTRMLLKSFEDTVLSFVLLLAISPVLLLIGAAVKLDSPGPVFFRQERTGFNGKRFRIWKFRTMFVHEPESGVIKQAERNDPRVTRVGAFLRRTSLDELPQLLNVLAGDMSLVGPRPHAIQHDAEYSRRIADYFARHKIKPGMTGLAQVRGYRGETRDIDLMIQRVESDIEYINHWSLWLDLTILLRTATVVAGKRAY